MSWRKNCKVMNYKQRESPSLEDAGVMVGSNKCRVVSCVKPRVNVSCETDSKQ